MRKNGDWSCQYTFTSFGRIFWIETLTGIKKKQNHQTINNESTLFKKKIFSKRTIFPLQTIYPLFLTSQFSSVDSHFSNSLNMASPAIPESEVEI